jgi:hypothetical protein
LWDDTYNEDKASGSKSRRIVYHVLFATIGIIIFAIVSNQSVNLFMNIVEFGGIFTKPLYYSLVSGLILSSIVLVRVDFRQRRSMSWYAFRLLINYLRANNYEIRYHRKKIGYSDYKMGKVSFLVWQITKIMIFAPLFNSLIFGMAVIYLFEGNDLGLRSIPNIFILPFANMPLDGNFAQDKVIPMVPVLTFIIPALLSAVGLRIFLYIGIAGSISVASKYIDDKTTGSKPKFLYYTSTVENIIGIALLWTAFTMFFSDNINYNTKYAILGTLVSGIAFIGYGFFDKKDAATATTLTSFPVKKHIYVRLLAILIVVIASGSIMAVNNSIADAKKIQWMGPYVAQEIAVNRYIAELDKVQIVNYYAKPPSPPSSISPSKIQDIVNENKDTLDSIRLWDRQAAQNKLKTEIGQKNDVNFAYTDILRFNNTIFWAAPTTPSLPVNITLENRWYNEHLVYTHATNHGVLMLDGHTGNIVEPSKYFKQKNIYYGQSDQTGNFGAWSAFPIDRTTSDEIGHYFYNGSGGINISPPLSWIFEPNFMLSYPDSSLHIMRFKDIYERMKLMYPYFVYDFGVGTSQNDFNVNRIGSILVTDEKDTYWLMPLIVLLDTSHVPWSSGSDMLRLVGYALISAYNGHVQLIVNSDDPFSRMFFEQNKGYNVVTEIPKWLDKQIQYPKEMFMWKINKFNQYHITDPKAFIEAQHFYELPADDPTAYYIIAKPPGFHNPEFVGLQSLRLHTSPGERNLVGYMLVQNNLENLGKMTFYSVPVNSSTILASPTAAREALEKDPIYAKEKILLSNLRVGDNVLYRLGGQEVYFIPVYKDSTAGGGVATRLATIATVSASVTGNFYVGLGNTTQQSFQNYLLKISDLSATEQKKRNETPLDKPSRIEKLEKIFTAAGLTLSKPIVISLPLAFKEADVDYLYDSDFAKAETIISKFIKGFSSLGGGVGIFEWQTDNKLNFGILKEVNGIIEKNHYVSIGVG